MASMKQPRDEIDEDAPTSLFVRPIQPLPSASEELASLTAIVGDLSKQVAGLAEVVAGQSPLVDLKTAAKHLGVSSRTVRRMVAADELPYRRFGRTLRFSLALLAPRRRREPLAAPPRLPPTTALPPRRRA
jgi:excisionase family DNA binding protein